jgi:SAM-dependent methyltransferase
VSFADEVRRQSAWRDWSRAFDALPALHGTTLLDLGCAVGDQAAELIARGARVIGIDASEELLREARARNLPRAEFRAADLRGALDVGTPVDGIWCSFAAAYFPDLPSALASWTKALRLGGWIALTEVDDLFGHEPLDERVRSLLNAYADESLAAGRYDFRMGGKLRAALERSGLRVEKHFMLEDQELAFTGAARPDVLDGWRQRFDRMTLLRSYCGVDFDRVRGAFLDCLARPDHRSTAKVVFCIATRTDAPSC